MYLRALVSPPGSFTGSPSLSNGFFKPNPNEQGNQIGNPTVTSDAVRANKANPPRITNFILPSAAPDPNHQQRLRDGVKNTTPTKPKAAIANANNYANLIHQKHFDSDPNSNAPKFNHLPSHGSGKQQDMKKQSRPNYSGGTFTSPAHPQHNNHLKHRGGACPEIPIYIGKIPIYVGKSPANMHENAMYESVGSDMNSSQSNALRIFQIYKDIASHRQGNSSIKSYFTKLKTLWDELETYSDLPRCYSSGAMKEVNERLEREKVMQFLLGLNDSYSTISRKILLIRPFPTVEKAYSIIGRTSALSILGFE